jgi:hypothetical protein
MPRAARLVPLAIVLIAGVVLLFRESDGSGQLSASVTPGAHEPVQRSVEVEQVLVTAEVVSPAGLQAQRAPAARPAPARRKVAVAEAAADPDERSTSLAAKTRRAILGDGRHKPQPFPRINNN